MPVSCMPGRRGSAWPIAAAALLSCCCAVGRAAQPKELSVDYEEWLDQHITLGSKVTAVQFSGNADYISAVGADGSGVINHPSKSAGIAFGGGFKLTDILLSGNGGVAAGFVAPNRLILRDTRTAAGAGVVYTNITVELKAPPLSPARMAFNENTIAACDVQDLLVWTLDTAGWRSDGTPPSGVELKVKAFTRYALPTGGQACGAMALSHDATKVVAASGKVVRWVAASGGFLKNGTLRVDNTIETQSKEDVAFISSSHETDYIAINSVSGRAEVWKKGVTTAQKRMNSIASMRALVGSGEQGIYGQKSWEIVAFADMTGVTVTSIFSFKSSLGLVSDWGSTGEPNAVALAYNATRLAIARGSTVHIYRGCIADMAAKHFNIPNNGYRKVATATLEQCRDECCIDQDKCKVFQWIGPDEPRKKGYPTEECLLFTEGESSLVEDTDQPFHTYIMRDMVDSDPVEEEDSILGTIMLALVLGIILCVICAICIFFAVRQLSKGRVGKGMGRSEAPQPTGRNNAQQEIDASLLQNEVGQEEGDGAGEAEMDGKAPGEASSREMSSAAPSPAEGAHSDKASPAVTGKKKSGSKVRRTPPVTSVTKAKSASEVGDASDAPSGGAADGGDEAESGKEKEKEEGGLKAEGPKTKPPRRRNSRKSSSADV